MATSHPIRSWDDCFIPDTTVLRNKFAETDPDRLRAKEEFTAHVRLAELAAHPIRGDFDYRHMRAIHRVIFQDVYNWAGHERVGPASRMTKEGPDGVWGSRVLQFAGRGSPCRCTRCLRAQRLEGTNPGCARAFPA